MTDNNNNIWEQTVRSKLVDFEEDVPAEVWEGIVAGLPAAAEGGAAAALVGEAVVHGGGKSVPFGKVWRYAAAAAVVAALICGGLYLLLNTNLNTVQSLVKVEEVGKEVEVEEVVAEENLNKVQNFVKVEDIVKVETVKPNRSPRPVRFSEKLVKVETVEEVVKVEPVKPNRSPRPVRFREIPVKVENHLVKAENHLVKVETPKRSKRWSFGFGGGGYAANVSNSGSSLLSPTYSDLLTDYYLEDNTLNGDVSAKPTHSPENLISTRTTELVRGSVKHKTPISAGIGVSYLLNDRWSLGSGLVYTCLRSEWEVNADAAKRLQTLHFIGLPLELQYKIAQWKKLRFYASAGGMGEFNFAGRSTKYGSTVSKESESIRITEPLWSLHARLGVAYPLCRYISIYAETGATYYFGYESNIETIRSDKPFFVTLQAGFRLGF